MRILKVASAGLVVILLLVNLPIILTEHSQATSQTEFSNGKSSDFIIFTEAGTDSSMKVQVPKGSVIKSFSVNITGLDDGFGNYPLNPRLDLGGDGDIEWGFNATGYGTMGHQTKLDNDQSSTTVYFSGPGSNSNTRILLPKDATIDSATLKLEGRKNDYGIKTVIDNNRDRISDMVTGDIDNDGDIDIVIQDLDHNIRWYNNTKGDGTTWTSYLIDNSFKNVTDLALADFSGDGALDLAASSWRDNNVVWYNNTDKQGRNWSSPILIDNGGATRTSHIEAGDLDGDGDLDIAATQSSSPGRVVWYNNTKGDSSAWTKHDIANLLGAEDLCIADIDDDGDNDTVVVNYWYDDVILYLNLGNASTWSAQKVISNNGLEDGANVDVGDFDEDGNIDVVAVGDSLRWFEAPDNPLNTWIGHTVANPGLSWYHGEVVTTDMGFYGHPPDGHLDFAMVTALSGDVIWFENDKDNPGSSFTAHVIRTDHTNARHLSVVDLGGETSYPDLIVAAYTSTTDDVTWYDVNMSYPLNVVLDVGGDGDLEYSAGAGYFNTQITTGDFKTELNDLLSKRVPGTDEYDNRIVTLPLKLTSSAVGKIIISDITIKYDYTATARIFPGGNLTAELQSHIGAVGSGPALKTVNLKFSAESAGKLNIEDLYIEYNDYPDLISSIPSDFSLKEDSIVDHLIDLRNYFEDDYISTDALTYEVVSYTNNDILDVTINDDYFLGVDSDTKALSQNWYGSADIQVRALDEDGLGVDSNVFSVNITPVNDEPLKGPDNLPVITLNEGQTSNSLFLIGSKTFFYDVENEPLYFDAEIDPENLFDDEQVTMNLDKSSWIITIQGLDDWFGDNVPFRVYCDDDPDVDKTIFRDTVINVYNVDDDAPIWKKLPEITVKEGSKINEVNDLFQVTDYVHDIDDDLFSLKFEVEDYTNSSELELKIDGQANLDLVFKNNDFNGLTTVKLSATDPGGNRADTIFDIIIEPVNDPPSVKIISPKMDADILVDSVLLRWEGSDVDNLETGLTYSLYFDSFGGETLKAENIKENFIRVEGLEDGETYLWKIVATDGMDKGESELTQFFVKFGDTPAVTLTTPLDRSVINKESIILEWSYDSPSVEYNNADFELYFESAENIDYSSGGIPKFLDSIYAVLNTEREYNISGLENGETYYWMVIPRLSDGGEGICSSGIWSFTVDFDAQSFGFDMELIEKSVIIEKGNSYSVKLRLVNQGINQDKILIKTSGGNLNSYLTIPELDSNGMITLQPQETRIINITVDGVNAPVSSSMIKIDATSVGDGSTRTEEMDLKIDRPKDYGTGDKSTGIFGENYLVIIALIFVIIIVILVVFFLVMKKRKKEEDIESEELVDRFESKGPPVYDAELISGPMSIQDVAKGGRIGPGGHQPGTAGLGPARPEGRLRLPPPKTKVIKKQKKRRISSQPLSVEDKKVVGPEVLLPFSTAKEGPKDEKIKAGASGKGGLDLTFKRPGEKVDFEKDADESSGVKEKKEKKKGPSVKLPGE